MKFYIIESGSKGNATLIENHGHLILLDMGITLSKLNEQLTALHRDINDLEGLLLTHEHSDHTKGIQYLPNIKIYCTEGTYDSVNVHYIFPYQPFDLIGLKITPICASHDAYNPVGFVLENESEKLVYLTDTGVIFEATLSYMENADYYIIEANHNQKMLHETDRPRELKARILGKNGHLCNEDSAIYMADFIGNKTKEIILAHLSEEANSPEVAIKAYRKILKRHGIDLDKIRLICANQHFMVEGGKND